MVPTVEREVRTGSLRSMAMAGGMPVMAFTRGRSMAVHELPGIGREGFHIAALALGVEGVQGQGGLAGAADARHHGKTMQGDLQVQILEIVLAGPLDFDGRIIHF